MFWKAGKDRVMLQLDKTCGTGDAMEPSKFHTNAPSSSRGMPVSYRIRGNLKMGNSKRSSGNRSQVGEKKNLIGLLESIPPRV